MPPVSSRSYPCCSLNRFVESLRGADAFDVASCFDVVDAHGVAAEWAALSSGDSPSSRAERLPVEGEELPEDVFTREYRDGEVGLRRRDDPNHRTDDAGLGAVGSIF